MLHPRHRAPIVGRIGNHTCDAVGIRLAGRQPKEQLGARVPQGGSEHRADTLGFASPLADVVDKRQHTTQPVVAPSVESPVDRSLSPPPQRPEGTCNHERGERRHPSRASARNDTADYCDDGIHETERCREQGVDERAVDQSIDLVQPVAHYGDAHRERDGRLHREQKRERRIAVLAEHQAQDEEAHDPQRDQKRRVGQPEHLQPLDPLGALVPGPRRRRADEETCEDRQPDRDPQKAENAGQSKRKRIRHIRERLLQLRR